mmetsp:Transcript_80445/g.167575  ORF Transcript_80445/g.167575 Transcript_80445/m.167575 type:complete len:239 (-) Transcript_80445:1730-2446(-)
MACFAVATILAPVCFFFRPSRMREPNRMLAKRRTSVAWPARASWVSTTSSVPPWPPLTWRVKDMGPETPSSRVPATILAALLPSTRSVGREKTNRSAGAGSSPVGASMSPAFTSSSMIFAANFWAPRPSSPARMRASSFSMRGMICFCNLGAPPAFFQAPLAYLLTEASWSKRMMKTIKRMFSRTSLVEHSSVVRRSWPNFLCSRTLSTNLPNNMAHLSRMTWNRFLSSGESEWREAM